MDYTAISQETMRHLLAGYESLKQSPLNQELRSLLELRVSQLNGCTYCCNLHEAGLCEIKVQQLPNFLHSTVFSQAEKEALSWAEALTKLSDKRRVEETKLAEYFSEREVVDITITISLMNMLNRLAISMRRDTGRRGDDGSACML